METIDACEKYLSGLGVSIWADWEIQNTERRHLAARWLAKQYEAVNTVMQEHDFPSQGGHVSPSPRSQHVPPPVVGVTARPLSKPVYGTRRSESPIFAPHDPYRVDL